MSQLNLTLFHFMHKHHIMHVDLIDFMDVNYKDAS